MSSSPPTRRRPSHVQNGITRSVARRQTADRRSASEVRQPGRSAVRPVHSIRFVRGRSDGSVGQEDAGRGGLRGGRADGRGRSPAGDEVAAARRGSRRTTGSQVPGVLLGSRVHGLSRARQERVRKQDGVANLGHRDYSFRRRGGRTLGSGGGGTAGDDDEEDVGACSNILGRRLRRVVGRRSPKSFRQTILRPGSGQDLRDDRLDQDGTAAGEAAERDDLETDLVQGVRRQRLLAFDEQVLLQDDGQMEVLRIEAKGAVLPRRKEQRTSRRSPRPHEMRNVRRGTLPVLSPVSSLLRIDESQRQGHAPAAGRVRHSERPARRPESRGVQESDRFLRKARAGRGKMNTYELARVHVCVCIYKVGCRFFRH